MVSLEAVNRFLDTYYGREKALRLLQYFAVLCDGLILKHDKTFKEKFLNWLLSKEPPVLREGVAVTIGNARIAFRLLGSIEMIRHVQQIWPTWIYIRAHPCLAFLDFVDIFSSLAYYPIEHLAWAGQMSLINIDTGKYFTQCTVLWLCSLLVNIIKAFVALFIEFKRAKRITANIIQVPQIRLLFLTLVQNFADLVNAIQFLPPGILWSGQLSPIIVGVLGIISSVIGLYRLTV